MFSDVQFYDYTKNPGQVANAKKFDNYHITLSYTGHEKNEKLAWKYLLTGECNVAVVFESVKRELPAFFNGCPVTSGDEGDFRPNDPNGVVVGLTAKSVVGGLNFVNNPFIIALNDERRSNVHPTASTRVVVEEMGDDFFHLYNENGDIVEADFPTYEEAEEYAGENGFVVVQSFNV